MSGRSLVSILALGLLSLAAPAVRADDELDRFVERNKVLAEKLRADVKAALKTSQTLERTDAPQARLVLDKVLTRLKAGDELPADEKAKLTSQVQARLRQVDELAREQRLAAEQAAESRRPRAERAEAGQGTAGQAQDFIDRAKAGVSAAEQRRAESARGFARTVDGIEASATLTDRDVTLPKDWAARSEMRKKLTGPQLSPKEVALLKALNSTMSVDFKDHAFKDVLNYLMDRTGQTIIVDQASLKDAMVDYEDPVTLKVNKVTVRTILKKVLADRGLSYVIKEGAVQVMSPQRAREMMVVRTYPIDDLVAPGQLARLYGPFVARAQMLQNVDGLIRMIQNTVDPTLWNANGGPGSIAFHEPSLSLVIRAPTEFHYQFATSGLR